MDIPDLCNCEHDNMFTAESRGYSTLVIRTTPAFLYGYCNYISFVNLKLVSLL